MSRRTVVLVALGTAAAGLLASTTPTSASPPPTAIALEPIGTYRHGGFEVSSAEIVAHDPRTQRLFVVNADPADPGLDILDTADPTAPSLVGEVRNLGGNPNSVAVSRGLVAVAVENPVKDEPGWVVFLDTDGNELNRVTVGALPDMLTFTPNGNQVVVANEGEPFAGFEGEDPGYDADRDPEGSVSVIDVRRGAERATVRAAGFEVFNTQRDQLIGDGVRLNPIVPTVAQDLEPEYVTVSRNSRTAWVVLQEANAIAEVDLSSVTVTDIAALDRKDHSIDGNGLDPSDRDGVADIRTVDNLNGIHMPDGIANVEFRGQTYILTANEGDARAYTGLTDEARVKDLRDVIDIDGRSDALCKEEFPNRAALVSDAQLGRLTVSTIDGFDASRNCYAELHAFGARSFSVFTTDGVLVFDSGDMLEQLTLAEEENGLVFNSDHAAAAFDNRSDNKGPEPEGITVETIRGRTYAFIGLERVGGVVTYDVTDPRNPVLVDYVNNRDFVAQLAGQDEFGEDFVPGAESGDLGPEGITVITAGNSPIGVPLVVVANEVSGTTTIFEVVRP